MRRRLSFLRGVAVAIGGLAAGVLLASASLPANADQNDPRLVSLFDLLKTTKNPVEAQAAEHRIWNIWMTSDDDTVTLLMIRGIDAMSSEDLQTALRIFSEMTEIAPDFAEGWNKRATVLYMIGAYSDSIADIDRVLALEPRHFGALSGLGLCKIELEQDEAALEAFERALSINPHMEAARANAEAIRQRIEGKAI